MGCLYQLVFPNGKKYIGIASRSAAKRFSEHVYASKYPEEFDFAIYRAFRKYGYENVKLETLVVSDSWEYLQCLEKRAIATFKTKLPNGYNMTDGGDGVVGYTFSEESRRKMSEARKGTTHSLEAREKMSSIRKGIKLSEETKEKMSKAKLGKSRPHFSEEHRKKISIGVCKNILMKKQLSERQFHA